MARDKQAIVLIPGLDPRPRNYYRDKLVSGLIHTSQSAKAAVTGEASVAGESGVGLEVNHAGGATGTIDVYEAYWFDLVSRVGQETPLAKISRGFGLLTYWFFSRVWLAMRGSIYITLGLLIASVLMLLWYYGVLALGLTAIGSDPLFLDTFKDVPVLNDLAGELGKLGRGMGNWKVWAAVTVLLGFIPLNTLVDIAYFSKRYLLNEFDDDGAGCRDKARKRVLKTIERVAADPSYRRVTVVGHSFGTVIGADIFADFSAHPGCGPVRLITLGSPIRVLSYRSRWLRAEVESCLRNPALDTWIDFYSDEDWMCAKVPGHGEGKGQISRRLVREASLLSRLNGQSHKAYYHSQEVAETLLEPTPSGVRPDLASVNQQEAV